MTREEAHEILMGAWHPLSGHVTDEGTDTDPDVADALKALEDAISAVGGF